MLLARALLAGGAYEAAGGRGGPGRPRVPGRRRPWRPRPATWRSRPRWWPSRTGACRRPTCSAAAGASRPSWRPRAGRWRRCTCARSSAGWRWPSAGRRWPGPSWPRRPRPAPGARPTSGPGRGTPPPCCGWPRATGRGPSGHSPGGSRWSTSTGPRWARPSCGPTPPATAPTWPASACAWRWRTGGRREVLRWAERGRAGALRRPAVHPPDDEQLAADLAELRRVRTELREARHRGRRRRGACRPGRRRWRSRSATAPGARPTPGPRRVGGRHRPGRPGRGPRPRSGDRVLVEYVALRRRAPRGHRQPGAGPAPPARVGGRGRPGAAVPAVRPPPAAVAPVAGGGRGGGGVDRGPARRPAAGAAAAARRACRWWWCRRASSTACRGRPCPAWPGGPPPSPRARPCGWVATRAGASSRRRRAARGRGRVALVAGPQLPGRRRRGGGAGRPLPGRHRADRRGGHRRRGDGRPGGADLVHLAAHGSFRADSPLFSSVLLADGPLTVYDLERLRRAPAVVVLSACEAAVAAVHDGDELLGTAAALLGAGRALGDRPPHAGARRRHHRGDGRPPPPPAGGGASGGGAGPRRRGPGPGRGRRLRLHRPRRRLSRASLNSCADPLRGNGADNRR